MNQNNSAILSVAASIEAKNLSVVLGGRRIIDIPSFSVFPNEVLAIIGLTAPGRLLYST
jgi:ABC-type hemin transport system ATPase subunit